MYANWANDPEVTEVPHLAHAHERGMFPRMVLADWVPRYAQPDCTSGPSCPMDQGEPIGSYIGRQVEPGTSNRRISATASGSDGGGRATPAKPSRP
jgi:hypothetical protein